MCNYTVDLDSKAILSEGSANYVPRHWDNLDALQDSLDKAGEYGICRSFMKRNDLSTKLIIASDSLDVDNGVSIVSGINCKRCAVLVAWGGQKYFTVRPDFGLLSIMSNLCEPGLNKYEWQLRHSLLGYHEHVYAIFDSVKAGHLSFTARHSYEWWVNFWKSRGFKIHKELAEERRPTEILSAGIQTGGSADDVGRAHDVPSPSQAAYTTKLLSIVDHLRSKIALDHQRWTREVVQAECQQLARDLSRRDINAIGTILLPDKIRGK